MTGLLEPNGHAYIVEVRRLGPERWEWQARCIVNNARFRNSQGIATSRKKAVAAGKAHAYKEEEAFYESCIPWERVG